MGGRVCGNKKGRSILLKFEYSKKQNVLIPNMASKVVHGRQIKSDEQFKFEILKNLRPINGAQCNEK